MPGALKMLRMPILCLEMSMRRVGYHFLEGCSCSCQKALLTLTNLFPCVAVGNDYRQKGDASMSSSESESENYFSGGGYERHYSSAPQRAAPAKAANKGKQGRPANAEPPRTNNNIAAPPSISARTTGRPPKRQAAKDAEKSWGEQLDDQLERALRGLGPVSEESNHDSRPSRPQRRPSPPPVARKAEPLKPTGQQAKTGKQAAVGRGKSRAEGTVMPKGDKNGVVTNKAPTNSMWAEFAKANGMWSDMRRDGKHGQINGKAVASHMMAWASHESDEDDEGIIEAGSGIGGLITGGWGGQASKNNAAQDVGRTNQNLFERALSRDTVGDALPASLQCQAKPKQNPVQQTALPQQHSGLQREQAVVQRMDAMVQTLEHQAHHFSKPTGATSMQGSHPPEQIRNEEESLPSIKSHPVINQGARQAAQQTQVPLQGGQGNQPGAGGTGRVPSPSPYLASADALAASQNMSSSPTAHATPAEQLCTESSVSSAAFETLSPSQQSVNAAPLADGSDVIMSTCEQDLLSRSLCMTGTLEDRLADTVGKTQQVRGALLLGRNSVNVVAGDTDGTYGVSSVRCAEIGAALADALRAARQAVGEVNDLPYCSKLQGLPSLEKHVVGLEDQAKALKGLLDSSHRRAELLAASTYSNKVTDDCNLPSLVKFLMHVPRIRTPM
jgi:hypothetical protein